MHQYRATVDRWVDGDTVDMVVDLGFRMTTHQRFRLLGDGDKYGRYLVLLPDVNAALRASGLLKSK